MNTLPEAFTEIGVTLDLLITGWSALGLLILGGLVILAGMTGWDGSLRRDVAVPVGGFLVVASAAVALIWVILLIPFDGKYHHYYAVEGRVTEVSNVLSEANGDLTRQPVITLDSVDRPLVIDDPRAVQLLDRDVTLRCWVDWHYAAADTYDCRIVAFGTES